MGTAITITPSQSVKSIKSEKGVTFSNVTGTTAETATGYLLIPAGTIAADNIIELTARILKTGTAGTYSARIFINTTNSISGGNVIALFPSIPGGNVAGQLKRTLHIPDNASLETLRLTAGAFTDDIADGGLVTAVVDWSVNQYIIIAITNASTADSTTGTLLALRIFK